MTRIALIVLGALFMCIGQGVRAEDFSVGSLKISAPWARATPKGATVGGGYMTITNTGTTPDRLVSGSSELSAQFEVHTMSMDNGVMKMRPVTGGVEIKPGQTVQFNPGSYHVMFVGLKKPFEQGQQVPAVLQFEKAGKVAVKFNVESIGAQSGGQMQHGH